MGAILAAVLSAVLSFVLRTVVVKFLMFAVVWVVTNFVLSEMISYLPDFSGGLTSAFSNFTSNMWFVADMCSITPGVPLMISAYIARFAIRRIPFIG